MAKFVKGVSGNPGGRPAGVGEIREIAREHTGAAIRILVKVMKDQSAAPSARVGAATALLDRGWGRPAQTLNATVEKNLDADAGLVGFANDLLDQMEANKNMPHIKRGSGSEPAPDLEPEGETPASDATH